MTIHTSYQVATIMQSAPPWHLQDKRLEKPRSAMLFAMCL